MGFHQNPVESSAFDEVEDDGGRKKLENMGGGGRGVKGGVFSTVARHVAGSFAE